METSRTLRRIGLEGLAFAANALLVPSATIFGGLFLMGVGITLVGTGIAWDDHPRIARILTWFLPPPGSYTGSAGAEVFAMAFLKANLVVYLATLPIRLFLRNRFGSSFRVDALVLLALTAAFTACLAVLILNVKSINDGHATMAWGSALFALVGYVLALPYIAVINHISKAIDALAEDGAR